MSEAKVSLIVPSDLHKLYPPKAKMTLMNVEGFIKSVRARLAQ
jgi:hypothetical protein